METTTQIPRQGTLLYMAYANNLDVDSSGVPTLNMDLKKFSYDLDNMEDTYARFIEVENEVRQNFPSSLLNESYLEKIWGLNNGNPIQLKALETIKEWGNNQISSGN